METVESRFRVEIFALCVAAAALIISCFYTALTIRGVEKFSNAESAKTVAVFHGDVYEYLAERLQSPLPWLFHEHKLFVSRILAYFPKEKKIDPLDLVKTGADLIPYAWKRENGFSVEDSTTAIADVDVDGFTNFEEFQAGTDPRDEESSPPAILKLRLEKYEAAPFKFIFKGYTANADGSYDFQLNVVSGKGPQTIFVKKGEKLEFEDASWQVGDFRLKIGKRMNPSTNLEQEFDESELDLARVGVGEGKMTLAKGQEMDSSGSKASFVSLIPSEAAIPAVSKGGIFVFREKEYLLIGANHLGATVKSLDNGKEYHVAAMNREERASMVLQDEKGKKK